jgi:hypothetical protein
LWKTTTQSRGSSAAGCAKPAQPSIAPPTVKRSGVPLFLTIDRTAE